MDIQLQYNVPESIQREATRIESLKVYRERGVKFDLEATGGNIDYLYRALGKNSDGSERIALLMSEDGASPQSLKEKATAVEVMLNKEWNDFVSFQFPTAKDAIKAMADMYSM